MNELLTLRFGDKEVFSAEVEDKAVYSLGRVIEELEKVEARFGDMKAHTQSVLPALASVAPLVEWECEIPGLAVENRPTNRRTRVTDEMCDECYSRCLEHYENSEELLDEIHQATGISVSTARIYVYVFKYLLTGKGKPTMLPRNRHLWRFFELMYGDEKYTEEEMLVSIDRLEQILESSKIGPTHAREIPNIVAEWRIRMEHRNY